MMLDAGDVAQSSRAWPSQPPEFLPSNPITMEKTKPDVVLLPSFDEPLQELRDALRELEAVTERILKRRGY